MNMIFRSLPVDGPLRITSPFGPRNTGISGASTYHKGIDLGRDFAKAQTAILAVAEGTVSSNYFNSYRGWVVTIKHDNVNTTLYQHLAERSPLSVGTRVAAGQKIGIMGNSSDRNVLKVAVHLHFELRENGNPVNAEPYLRNIQKGEEEMTEAEVKAIVKEVLAESRKDPSAWAAEAWEQAKREGITDGSNPHAYPTREQVVQLVMNAKKVK